MKPSDRKDLFADIRRNFGSHDAAARAMQMPVRTYHALKSGSVTMTPTKLIFMRLAADHPALLEMISEEVTKELAQAEA